MGNLFNIWGTSLVRENLTFEDGIILCKHIYQSAIDKTLNGVIEQEQIFFRAHDALDKIQVDHKKERLDELFFLLNMEDVYRTI